MRASVIGFRFWRAVGETLNNYAKLWTNSGTQLAFSNAFPAGVGWVEVYLSSPVAIAKNTVYVASVNTNSWQVKTGGGYALVGHISNGPLYSSGGYYGQPIHDKPASSSASYFFVDPIIEEREIRLPLDPREPWDPPFAPPVVERLQANLVHRGQEVVVVRVCNPYENASEPSQLRFQWHADAKSEAGGLLQSDQLHSIEALAPGACQDVAIPAETAAGSCSLFRASLEGAGERQLTFCR